MITSIITCDLRTDYLSQTMSNVKSFGLDPIVFHDTYEHSLPDNKSIAFDAMKYAYDKKEDLLFLEDDILIQDKSLIAYNVPDNCLFTSFYNSYLTTGRHSCIRFGECQALLLPIKALQYILMKKEGCQSELNLIRGLGPALKLICRGCWFEVTKPMVSHIGYNSTFSSVKI